MARQGSYYDGDFSEPAKPPRRDSHALDAFLILALGALVTVLVVPSLRSRAMRALTFQTQTKIAQSATVWANKDAGYYYCYGSRFYGHGPGAFMKQGDALTLGYQPEMKKYCSGPNPADSKAVNSRKTSNTRTAATGTDTNSIRGPVESSRPK